MMLNIKGIDIENGDRPLNIAKAGILNTYSRKCNTTGGVNF